MAPQNESARGESLPAVVMDDPKAGDQVLRPGRHRVAAAALRCMSSHKRCPAAAPRSSAAAAAVSRSAAAVRSRSARRCLSASMDDTSSWVKSYGSRAGAFSATSPAQVRPRNCSSSLAARSSNQGPIVILQFCNGRSKLFLRGGPFVATQA